MKAEAARLLIGEAEMNAEKDARFDDLLRCVRETSVRARARANRNLRPVAQPLAGTAPLYDGDELRFGHVAMIFRTLMAGLPTVPQSRWPDTLRPPT